MVEPSAGGASHAAEREAAYGRATLPSAASNVLRQPAYLARYSTGILAMDDLSGGTENKPDPFP